MKNLKNYLKEKKGITLVALVITIIVLLILAGISLNLIMGDGGILNRATNARKTSDIAGAQEKVELLVAEASYDYLQARYVNGNGSLAEGKDAYILRLLNQKVGSFEGCTLALSDHELTLSKDGKSVTGTIGTDGTLTWADSTSGGSTNTVANTSTNTTSNTTSNTVENTTGGGTGSGVSVTIVNDANSNNKADVGEEVAIGNEHFYVIKKYTENSVNKVTLLAKYNLATTPNSTTGKYEQQNANNGTTACAFSNSNYWSADWVSGTRINLNTWETTYSKTMPNTETTSNNAIKRARKYGQDLVGVEGRLLTYDEANTSDTTNCLFQTSAMQTILYGSYSGTDAVKTDCCLVYWLGSADENSSTGVWIVNGYGSYLDLNSYSSSCGGGVRPVLEVSESLIQ
ncbi:MAG: hypothetical protein IIY81_04550 [Lachnospiraceae bacterium]|nr:hypothetical protein [Lachnospiraceae bacterium]